MNELLGDNESYIAHFEELLPLLADTGSLEKQLENLTAQHMKMMNNLRCYMEENTRQVQDQAEYNRRFSQMSTACTELEAQIATVKEDILAQQGRKEQIRRCFNELRQCGDILEEFDLELWNVTVESATISASRTFTIRFRDGTEIPVHSLKKK